MGGTTKRTSKTSRPRNWAVFFSGVESEQVRHDFLVFFANSSPKTQAKLKLTDILLPHANPVLDPVPCPRPPAPPKSLPGL